MTYEEREAIFAKEVLGLDDVMKLFDIKGKLHVEDYLLYHTAP